MLTLTRTVDTFPSVRLPSHSGGLPVEVALIAQLGVGSGDQLITAASARQRGHAAFIDELDEPSARIGGIDLAKGDASSLYTFAVGAKGHPFHRHAGHRVFTAISGSSGSQLRFSTASPEQIAEDPRHFVRALRHVNIPPDCLFTVRFGGGTWHQFVPLKKSVHPALFALSCHTNELGGDLDETLRLQVAANAADIPSLTEVLPATLHAVLEAQDPAHVPTVALSLDAAPVSLAGRLCAWTRAKSGPLRAAIGRWRGARGFVVESAAMREVAALERVPEDSLLRTQLPERIAHEDTFALMTESGELGASATVAMERVLDGFLENRPQGVSWLMAFRNVLVKPIGLRTSPLGCPVSSLLGTAAEDTFAGRFKVIAKRVAVDDRRVEVILGADDKHLAFRSCVGVEVLADGRARVTLGTRVRTHNAFGRFYMAAIDPVHRLYITPAMLRMAVDHAVNRQRYVIA